MEGKSRIFFSRVCFLHHLLKKPYDLSLLIITKDYVWNLLFIFLIDTIVDKTLLVDLQIRPLQWYINNMLKFKKSRQNEDVFGSQQSSKGHGSTRSVTHFRELDYFHHFCTVAVASFGWIKFGLRFLTAMREKLDVWNSRIYLTATAFPRSPIAW